MMRRRPVSFSGDGGGGLGTGSGGLGCRIEIYSSVVGGRVRGRPLGRGKLALGGAPAGEMRPLVGPLNCNQSGCRKVALVSITSSVSDPDMGQ